MTSEDRNEVHQAVFGYSNGHRMLASSVQLNSVDVYELAAASDLAPGVSLDPSESYLSGVALPESRLYALIKTWAAPEMQRPGCVWSHVLLLSRQFLSTQVDLAVLVKLFSRPANYQRNNGFSKPLAVGRRDRASPPVSEIVEQALLACYNDVLLDSSRKFSMDRERAILAVWSQQWPRLRSAFSFRSVASSSLFPGQTIRLEPERKLQSSQETPWLPVALEDAVSISVTPLRRFLWRYGKDIDPALRPFTDLVEIFILIDGGKASYSAATEVLKRFGAGQALTLKQDILGLSGSRGALVKSVSAADLLRLMASHDINDIGVADRDLLGLFQDIDEVVLVDVISALGEINGALGERYHAIFEALLPSFTQAVLVSEAVPEWMVFNVLAERSDLIETGVLQRLNSQRLVDMLDLDLTDESLHRILRQLLQLPPIADSAAVLQRLPLPALNAAIGLFQESVLESGWRALLHDYSEELVSHLPALNDGRAAFSCAKMLSFPLPPNDAPSIWYSIFEQFRGDFDRSTQTTQLVYVFVLCIHHGLEKNRRIAAQVMPELRARVMSGGLSTDDEMMLGRWLPHHTDSWDINRRMLKLVRQAYKRGSRLDDLVTGLGLSDSEYAYATNQDPDNLVRQVFRVFMPWGQWE